MADREKVIQGLKCCQGWDDSGIYEGLHPDWDGCRKCPYLNEGENSSECHDALLCDALELLKAQANATVKQGTWDERQVESDNIWTRRRFYCSCCGGWQTYGKTKYCPNCGAEMGEGVTNDA